MVLAGLTGWMTPEGPAVSCTLRSNAPMNWSATVDGPLTNGVDSVHLFEVRATSNECGGRHGAHRTAGRLGPLVPPRCDMRMWSRVVGRRHSTRRGMRSPRPVAPGLDGAAMRTALLLLCMACGTNPSTPPPTREPGTAPSAAVVPYSTSLDAPRLLRRISLDLRGVLPSTEELDHVESQPEAVWNYRDAWLADPRLEGRLVQLLAERWHTRVDDFLVQYLDYQALASEPGQLLRFERSVGEEPLRLLARIAVSDRPWTDVVTTDHTMADERLASIWPLERQDGTGWQVASYTDGRPAAGVLATNGLWWRYYTTRSNANRARVAAISRLLVCEDYAARTITFAEDDALAAGADLEDALQESPYCQGCHAGLDPIAAALYGFWSANEYQTDEIDTYHPERERLGSTVLGVQPAWYGDPVAGLHELGAHIASDPLF